MRYLILSDIHGNWDALEQCCSMPKVPTTSCCAAVTCWLWGRPNRVTDWCRANVAIVIRGNHDKACTTGEELEWFNAAARASALWTHDTLTPDNFEYLKTLAKGPVQVADFQMVHGSFLDEDEYITCIEEADAQFPYLQPQLTLFGHTHVQGAFYTTVRGATAFAHRRQRDLVGPAAGSWHQVHDQPRLRGPAARS